MSIKVKKIIFYSIFLIFILASLWYISTDYSNNSLSHWVNTWEKGSEIIVGETEILPPTADEISSAIEKSILLNINTATKSELVALETIGEVTAKKIISHRETNGYFKSINELLSNSVITQRQFNAIKEEITV